MYCYEYVENGKTKFTCKVKGLTLDYNTSRNVNFNTMSDWLKNERDTFSITVEYKYRIKKNKNRRVTSETKTEDLSFYVQQASNPVQWNDGTLWFHPTMNFWKCNDGHVLNM